MIDFLRNSKKNYIFGLSESFSFLLTISNSIFNSYSSVLFYQRIHLVVSLGQFVCSLYLVSLAIVVVDIVIVGVASVVVVTYTPYFPLGSCWFDYTGQRLPRMEARG